MLQGTVWTLISLSYTIRVTDIPVWYANLIWSSWYTSLICQSDMGKLIYRSDVSIWYGQVDKLVWYATHKLLESSSPDHFVHWIIAQTVRQVPDLMLFMSTEIDSATVTTVRFTILVNKSPQLSRSVLDLTWLDLCDTAANHTLYITYTIKHIIVNPGLL